MTKTEFSEKQLKVLSWWSKNSPYSNCEALICDGAVRSGKTFSMSLSFYLWAMSSFNGQNFAICGKTIKSAKRNITVPILPVLKKFGFSIKERHAEGMLEISSGGRMNRFYIFGGKDSGSASLIQGMTLAGALFDEVVLMPQSFTEQAIARCSVEKSKLWFNCNPEGPLHWFYTEWIQKKAEKNALYIHFTMRDNPSLSGRTIARYERLFSGIFYRRYILGEWVKSDGLIYPFMDRDMYKSLPISKPQGYALSVDYGTVNPTSAGLWGKYSDKWYRIDEYYFDSRKEKYQRTDEEHLEGIKQMLKGIKPEFIVIDPSAASFITLLIKNGFSVRKADNNVVNGIRTVSSYLVSGKINICINCMNSRREFELYSWKDNGSKDEPIKQNDHAMDEIRYFAMELKKQEEKPAFYSVVRR